MPLTRVQSVRSPLTNLPLPSMVLCRNFALREAMLDFFSRNAVSISGYFQRPL